jgi:tetratricopeptide (TPR) repeat protein
VLHRAVSIWETSLNPDHPLVAAGLQNLGVVYTNLGRFDEAEASLTRALRIARATLPPDHPNLTAYMNSYAYLLRRLDRKKEARELEQTARVARERYMRQNLLGNTVDTHQFVK